jgi:hypothetical protein
MMVPAKQEVDQPQRADNVDCSQPYEPRIPSAPASTAPLCISMERSNPPGSSPVLPLGAGCCRGRSASSWSARSEARRTTLTVIFARRENARREEGGPAFSRGCGVPRLRCGRDCLPAGAGPLTWWRRRRAQRAPARQGAPLKIHLMARPGHADVVRKWHSSARMACRTGNGRAAASP